MIQVDSHYFYMDYVNNYLTVSKIAADYEISLEEAFNLIEEGRQQYN